MVLATYLMQKIREKIGKFEILFFTLQILCQYFDKILNISENTQRISTNLVLNGSL